MSTRQWGSCGGSLITDKREITRYEIQVRAIFKLLNLEEASFESSAFLYQGNVGLFIP